MEKQSKDDLVLAKKFFVLTYIVAVLCPSLPLLISTQSLRMSAFVLIFFALAYLNYIVYFRGLRALSVFGKSSDLYLAAKVNLYVGTLAYVLELISTYFTADPTANHLIPTMLNGINSLLLILVCLYTGKGLASLQQEIFGDLPAAIQKYYYFVSIACGMFILAALFQNGARVLFLVIGALLMVAILPAIIGTYKVFKIAISNTVVEDRT